jgi:hypothetical protein
MPLTPPPWFTKETGAGCFVVDSRDQPIARFSHREDAEAAVAAVNGDEPPGVGDATLLQFPRRGRG